MALETQKALIEVSSEAGRKIGGIYTVIRSKAPLLHKKFGDKYLLIGMLDSRCDEDVAWEEPQGKLAAIFAELGEQGVRCRTGTWIYGDNARIICVDAKEAAERVVEYSDGRSQQRDRQINCFKFMLWKNFGIDSINEKSWDFTENAAWCFGVGMLLEKLFSERLFDAKKTAVQFHEWISGAALLYCKMKGVKVGTVFTTHATVLGRTLAASGIDVYADAAAAKEPVHRRLAYEYHVEGKHLLEAAAARECSVFTTVSDTVALEVAYVLGRKADVVTVNGIEHAGKRGPDENSMGQYARAELRQLAEACFVSYYTQRYDDALFVYISGRYEFSNKGFDVFISALGRLNERLKKRGAKARRVFAFIFAPTAVKGPKISIIKNYLLLDKIDEVFSVLPETRGRDYANLQDAVGRLRGMVKLDVQNMTRGFYKDGERPHINCYDLAYPNDAIIGACVTAGLDNREENPVKVLYYPTYMKPNDGLMNLNYYDVISAMDVGVFPSRYEPYGYTPVETALRGGIAITSDMTGFGRYMQEKVGRKGGICVIRMAGLPQADAADELSRCLERIYQLSPLKLANEKARARELAKLVEWRKLIGRYYKAYEMAIAKAQKAGQ